MCKDLGKIRIYMLYNIFLERIGGNVWAMQKLTYITLISMLKH